MVEEGEFQLCTLYNSAVQIAEFQGLCGGASGPLICLAVTCWGFIFIYYSHPHHSPSAFCSLNSTWAVVFSLSKTQEDKHINSLCCSWRRYINKPDSALSFSLHSYNQFTQVLPILLLIHFWVILIPPSLIPLLQFWSSSPLARSIATVF